MAALFSCTRLSCGVLLCFKLDVKMDGRLQ